MSRYFDFETDGATLHIPYNDAPGVIARNAAALTPAYFVAFLEALVEALGENERAEIEKEFRKLFEHRQGAIRVMFEDLAPGGGQ